MRSIGEGGSEGVQHRELGKGIQVRGRFSARKDCTPGRSRPEELDAPAFTGVERSQYGTNIGMGTEPGRGGDRSEGVVCVPKVIVVGTVFMGWAAVWGMSWYAFWGVIGGTKLHPSGSQLDIHAGSSTGRPRPGASAGSRPAE